MIYYTLAVLPNSFLQMIFINILYVLNSLLHYTSYSVHYRSNLFTIVFQTMFSLYSKLFYHTYAFKLFYRLTSSRSFLKNNTYISNVLQNLFMLLYYKLHASICIVI